MLVCATEEIGMINIGVFGVCEGFSVLGCVVSESKGSSDRSSKNDGAR